MGNSATTPIVAGFYPDPTICRVGQDYYLAQSSFEFFPGVPLWHSTDLLNWQSIGHVLTRRSQFARGDGRDSGGIYAGTLRHHDDRFWYVTTNISDYDAGQILVHATSPEGPWSEPVRVPAAIGIDPDLAWDADGQCFLSWKGMDFTDGEVGILQARLDPATGELLDEPYPIWQGSGLAAAEGPHLYEIDGTWYLVLAEGGTERGHAVTVARGPRPQGPFEGCPANPVLSHRSSIHPVQNTGHADLVRAPDGGWAAVYLGARTAGSTPGFHVLGRETFLAGVDWVDGWPVVVEDRFTVPAVDHGFTESFAAPSGRWVVPGGEPETVATWGPDGLVLAPQERLLCTRVRDLRWQARAVVGEGARLVLRLDDRHWCALAVAGGVVTASVRIGDVQTDLASVALVADEVVLQLTAQTPTGPTVPLGHAGPDEIVLSAAPVEAEPVELARLDGRYLSTEVASGFTGRVLGLGATTAPAHVMSFTYTSQS